MPKVKIDNLEVPYSVVNRSIHFPRLEFRTGNLLVVLPKHGREATSIIEKHKKWILEKRLAIDAALLRSTEKKLVQTRSTEDLKKMVYSLIREFSAIYGFQVKNTYFRKMNSKWASHSSKDNLTINTEIKYLPRTSIEYIIYHEMVHSLERKHNPRFWKIIERRFKGYKKKEKELMTYWFLIQNHIGKGE